MVQRIRYSLSDILRRLACWIEPNEYILSEPPAGWPAKN